MKLTIDKIMQITLFVQHAVSVQTWDTPNSLEYLLGSFLLLLS